MPYVSALARLLPAKYHPVRLHLGPHVQIRRRPRDGAQRKLLEPPPERAAFVVGGRGRVQPGGQRLGEPLLRHLLPGPQRAFQGASPGRKLSALTPRRMASRITSDSSIVSGL